MTRLTECAPKVGTTTPHRRRPRGAATRERWSPPQGGLEGDEVGMPRPSGRGPRETGSWRQPLGPGLGKPLDPRILRRSPFPLRSGRAMTGPPSTTVGPLSDAAEDRSTTEKD